MNALRLSVLLFVFGCMGIVLAGIRVEQTRCMARIQNTRLKQLSLRRTLQGQQLQIARLRSPDQVTRRIDRLRLQVFDCRLRGGRVAGREQLRWVDPAALERMPVSGATLKVARTLLTAT